jgi:hypothetical protein
VFVTRIREALQKEFHAVFHFEFTTVCQIRGYRDVVLRQAVAVPFWRIFNLPPINFDTTTDVMMTTASFLEGWNINYSAFHLRKEAEFSFRKALASPSPSPSPPPPHSITTTTTTNKNNIQKLNNFIARTL